MFKTVPDVLKEEMLCAMFLQQESMEEVNLFLRSETWSQTEMKNVILILGGHIPGPIFLFNRASQKNVKKSVSLYFYIKVQ